MSETIRAVYHDGAFWPAAPCLLPEQAEVELTVRAACDSQFDQPTDLSSEERRSVLLRVVERMSKTVLSADAPTKFARDEMHERG